MKKILFYMLSQEEEQDLVDFLRKDRNVKIVCYKTLVPEPDIRDIVPTIGRDYFHYYFWDVDHSPPPINKYIPTQNHYVIDFLQSEIMEFNRCSIRYDGSWGRHEDGVPWVNIGRIAISHKKWVNGELVECPKHFLALFEQARKWVKKNGVCIKEGSHKGMYVLPSAQKFFEEGGKTGPY